MLGVEQAALHLPSLAELRIVLQKALRNNFAQATVDVVQCPDLREEPWNLLRVGLAGSTTLLDVGGVPNLLDPRYHHLAYDSLELMRAAGVDDAVLLGPGAADSTLLGGNGELWVCEEPRRKQSASKAIRVVGNGQGDDSFEVLAHENGRVGYLANLIATKGQSGAVIHVRASRRTGTGSHSNLVSVMRKALDAAYGSDKPVGLGGVFTMHGGMIKAHVMPDFKSTCMVEGPEVDEWLRFYEWNAQGCIFISTLVSSDPSNLNLRLEHTHFYNRLANRGGHYHYDITPDEAIYEGYFIPAHRIVRIENAYQRSSCRLSK